VRVLSERDGRTAAVTQVKSGAVPCSFTLAHYADICSIIGACGYQTAFLDEVAGFAECAGQFRDRPLGELRDV